MSGIKLAPVLIFAGLAAMFSFALKTGDPSRLPSTLIGKPVPQFNLPAVGGLRAGANAMPGFSSDDLAGGKISIVNFWASWCAACVGEHPQLEALKTRAGVPIYGVNYKDDPANARRFLRRLGNPYTAVGADRSGRVAIDWGVYGMPESFLINGKGEIIYKHIGPISRRDLEERLLPLIAKARRQKPGLPPAFP